MLLYRGRLLWNWFGDFRDLRKLERWFLLFLVFGARFEGRRVDDDRLKFDALVNDPATCQPLTPLIVIDDVSEEIEVIGGPTEVLGRPGVLSPPTLLQNDFLAFLVGARSVVEELFVENRFIELVAVVRLGWRGW